MGPTEVREPSNEASAVKQTINSCTTVMIRNQYVPKEYPVQAAKGVELRQVEKDCARQFVCTAPVGVKTALTLSFHSLSSESS